MQLLGEGLLRPVLQLCLPDRPSVVVSEHILHGLQVIRERGREIVHFEVPLLRHVVVQAVLRHDSSRAGLLGPTFAVLAPLDLFQKLSHVSSLPDGERGRQRSVDIHVLWNLIDNAVRVLFALLPCVPMRLSVREALRFGADILGNFFLCDWIGVDAPHLFDLVLIKDRFSSTDLRWKASVLRPGGHTSSGIGDNATRALLTGESAGDPTMLRED